jgi:hypothetical protein
LKTKNNGDLKFLKMLVVKIVRQPLVISLSSEQKFDLYIEGDYLLVVREGTREGIETNSRSELSSFIMGNSKYLEAIDEDQLYLMLVQDSLKAVLLEGGASREDLQSLIGSVAEYEPKESVSYLSLLRGTK